MALPTTNLLPASVLALAAVLVFLTWYATLMPLWLTQAGERGNTIYYSQGMGIWLNYTEHVGDATFDPGNSLWVPPQQSAAHSYSDQCATTQSFCADAVGELHKQYCQVLEVYCGGAVTFLQVALSVMAGFSLVVLLWAVHMVSTTHRTLADRYLMHLCVFNGIGFLATAVVWYFCFFRPVLSSTFYKDQFSRCSESSEGRKCWRMGLCVYLLIVGGVLYPVLSVLVVSHITNKFHRYQQVLRRLYESAAVVDLPRPLVAMKEHMVSGGDDALQSGEVVLDVEEHLQSASLAPLKKHPSAVKAQEVKASQVPGTEVEEEKQEESQDEKKHGTAAV